MKSYSIIFAQYAKVD